MNLCSGQKKIVCVYGPTASGKTDFAACLAGHAPIEIINMDSAQLYTPLTIGTAKPDWKATAFKQHMFDYFDIPVGMTVHTYRERALHLVEDIWSRNHIPVFVGGSGFYLKTLLFPLQEQSHTYPHLDDDDQDSQSLWDRLHAIDPVRAYSIHPHDVYRLKRALNIWYTTGKKPSCAQPEYHPIAPFILVKINCERDVLYSRINQRVYTMIENGWIQEVQSLLKTPWQDFVVSKGFIGYAQIIDHINQRLDFASTIEIIQRKTRNYAKRQEIFWRMLKKKLLNMAHSDTLSMKQIVEIDLTSDNLNLYIKQLLDSLYT